MMIFKLKIYLSFIVYLPLILKYYRCKNCEIIDKDVIRWINECFGTDNKRSTYNLIKLLRFKPQFRNLFFFRIKSNSNFLKFLCKPDESLTIAEDCGNIEGGGLFFMHAFSSILEVNKIGFNCTIRQNTTLGVKTHKRHDERPWIGNNVDFGANVVCIGNVHIGNNVIIGAGSVVVKDIPDNAIVAGNPARVIKFRDNL